MCFMPLRPPRSTTLRSIWSLLLNRVPIRKHDEVSVDLGHHPPAGYLGHIHHPGLL
jgi:hypothetical protein